jgi:hypothetical protein
MFPSRLLKALPGVSKTCLFAGKVLGVVGAGISFGVYCSYGGMSAYILYKHYKYMAPLKQIELNKELSSEQKVSKSLEYLQTIVDVNQYDIEKIGQKMLKKLEENFSNHPSKQTHFVEKVHITKLTPGAEEFVEPARQWLSSQLHLCCSRKLFYELNHYKTFEGLVNKLANKLYRKSLKKKDKMERYIGPHSYKLLKNSLKNRDEQKAEESVNAGAIIHAVKKEAIKQKAIHMAIVGLCLLGMTAFIVSSVFSGGIPFIVATTAFFLVSVGMLGIDLYMLKEALKEGKLNRKEKIIMASLSVLLIFSLVLSSLASGGLLPLLATAIVGLTWAALYLYILISNQYHQRQKQNNE